VLLADATAVPFYDRLMANGNVYEDSPTKRKIPESLRSLNEEKVK